MGTTQQLRGLHYVAIMGSTHGGRHGGLSINGGMQQYVHKRRRQGGGGWGCNPLEFYKWPFSGKNTPQVIFRQNHLIFGQALEKIFGQETSGPPVQNWSSTPMSVWFIATLSTPMLVYHSMPETPISPTLN